MFLEQLHHMRSKRSLQPLTKVIQNLVMTPATLTNLLAVLK